MMTEIIKQMAQQAKHSKELMIKYKNQVWEGEHAKINKKVNVNFAKQEYNYRMRLLEEYVEKHHLYSEYLEAIAYIEGI